MPTGEVKLNDNAFAMFKGSEQDRKDIIAIHRAYLDANTNSLSEQELRAIWSADPNCVWFNGTGFNYYGLEDWLKLWAYYRERVRVTEPWGSYDVRVIGDGDMAVVTSGRVAMGEWIGKEAAPEWTRKRWRSRSTEVFRKTNGKWECVHIHVSTEPEGPRHEQRV